jgi:hypothetical protein
MRHRDWSIRLNKYIEEHFDTPFEWGEFDCCLFAADAVMAMTDIDFAEEFRGHYATAIGAKRILRKTGKGSIKQTVESKFGPMKSRLSAGRGDIVLINTSWGEALGIVAAGKIWAPSENGLTTMSMQCALGCWRVPCQQ